MEMILWAIALLVLGLLVFGLEFMVPSAGMLGVLATVLLIASVVVASLHDWRFGIGIGLAMVCLMPFFFIAAVKLWPHTYIGKRILIGETRPDDVIPDPSRRDLLKSLQGRIAIAKTKMLPGGVIEIDGRQYNAVADGFAIEPGQTVQIVSVRNNRLVVQPDASIDALATDQQTDAFDREDKVAQTPKLAPPRPATENQSQPSPTVSLDDDWETLGGIADHDPAG